MKQQFRPLRRRKRRVLYRVVADHMLEIREADDKLAFTAFLQETVLTHSFRLTQFAPSLVALGSIQQIFNHLSNFDDQAFQVNSQKELIVSTIFEGSPKKLIFSLPEITKTMQHRQAELKAIDEYDQMLEQQRIQLIRETESWGQDVAQLEKEQAKRKQLDRQMGLGKGSECLEKGGGSKGLGKVIIID